MNSKNIYKSLLALTMVIGIGGCQKSFLDTKIDTSQTIEDVNSNYASLFSFANAPYVFMRNEFTMIDNNLFASVSDEAEPTAASSNALFFDQGIWNANTNPDNYYLAYYAGIRAANYFIDYSPNYKSFLGFNRDTMSASGKLNYHNDVMNVGWFRGEAHILRAYFYFELAKRYGGVPLVTKVLSATDNTNIPQTSYDSIINFVVSEIDTYKDSLQINWKTSSFSNYDGRFSLGSALSLKARALLFAASPLHNANGDIGKWQKAASALHDVLIFAKGGGQYSLNTDYKNYFLANNTLTSNETILAVRYAADHVMETNNYPIATPGGNSGITPSQNLVADYEYTGVADPKNPYANRDPRLAFTVVTNNSTWNNRTINESAGATDDMSATNTSKTGYYLKKFLNDGLNLIQGQTAVHNWPAFRYGEVLLEYAEAMNESFGPDIDNGYGMTARVALNSVRSRAGVGMPAVLAVNQTDFRAAVKHERRIELAFEDYRYWDLLRWKDAATVLNQPLQGVHVVKNADGSFSYTVFNVENRVFDASKMYLYPFAQTEILKSKGVLKQNIGW